MRTLDRRPPRSILVVCLRLIGDVILATPVVDALARRWPDAAIDLLVNRGTGEFLRKDPRVRKVIAVEGPREPGLEKGRGEHYLGRILFAYDLSVNLTGSDRGAIAAILSGRRARVSLLSSREKLGGLLWKRLLLGAAVPFPPGQHIADLVTLVMRAMGEDPGQPEVRLYWDREDESAVAAALAPLGGRPYLSLHSFARWPFKEVPDGVLARAAAEIAGPRGWGVAATSGPGEAEKKRLAGLAFPPGIAVAKIPGALSLNGIACLLAGARFYLGLDTAVTHIAASAGAPMVAVFGPTPLSMWGPWNNARPAPQYGEGKGGGARNGHIRVIQRGWECAPCGRMGCDDSRASRCLDALTAGEIVSAADELLARPG